MSNPVITAIKSGNAPKPARLAAARGMLPLAQEDMVEVLLLLFQDPEDDVKTAAQATFDTFEPNSLLPIAQNQATSATTLSFLSVWSKCSYELLEAVILNETTPDEAIAYLAGRPLQGSLLEAITINQQRMIRYPAIIDNILINPVRTPEAERRAREVKVEFFEKELGASRVAEEMKARARVSQALGIEISEDEFQQVLSEFESDTKQKIENGDAEPIDPEAELKRILFEFESEGEAIDNERRSIYKLLASMTVKERIFVGLKGNREVRMILVRDSNKLVSSAVLKNPKITDAEVEAVSKIKGISEEVLRIICMNRAWISSYSIMHNLVCNPRTPLNYSMDFLKRLQNKDLKTLSKNKGVPDILRTMANRLVMQRQG